MQYGRRHFLIAGAVAAFGGLSVPWSPVGAASAGRPSAGPSARPPGRVVAVVRRFSAQGSLAFTRDAILALPGVIDIVPIHSGIAVLGTNLRQAERGAAALAAEDVPRPSAEAARETTRATVWFHDGDCEAWVSGWAGDRDGKGRVHRTLRDLAGLPPERISVRCTDGIGDRYPATEYLIEAAELARLTGLPVELVWTRKDDLHYGLAGESTPRRLRAALDDAGVSHAICDAPGHSCDAIVLDAFVHELALAAGSSCPRTPPLHL